MKISKLLLTDPTERVWYYLNIQFLRSKIGEYAEFNQWYLDALNFYAEFLAIDL